MFGLNFFVDNLFTLARVDCVILRVDEVALFLENSGVLGCVFCGFSSDCRRMYTILA